MVIKSVLEVDFMLI